MKDFLEAMLLRKHHPLYDPDHMYVRVYVCVNYKLSI